MKPAFRRTDSGIRMELEDFEVQLLRDLPAGLRGLLEEPDDDDPVFARLFPRGVVGDDIAAAELRRMTYEDLLRQRLVGLEALGAILDRGEPLRSNRLRVELVDDEPELVLGVINDVRLTLGVRAGIEHLDRDDIDEDHPAAAMLAVMDHLAWLQEQLLEVLDPPSVRHYEG